MDTVLALLQFVIAIAFMAAAIGATSRWMEQRGTGNGWAAAAFLTLSAATVYQIVAGREPGPIEQKALGVVVVLFPYFLLRFASSFSPISAAIRYAAAIVTVALLGATVLIPPVADSTGTGWALAYLGGLLVAWGAWPSIAAVRLWSLGRNAPGVPRRRVRLLAIASVCLAVAVAVSIVIPAQRVTVQFVIHALTLLSGIAFYVGFAPPRVLRVVWRQREQERLHATIQTLVSSPTVGSLVSSFLPQAAELVGADALTLLDSGGREVAACPAEAIAPSSRQRIFDIDLPNEARLKVVAGAASPHFGKDELELLRSIGSLAVLAIDRTELHEAAQVAQAEAERANKAKSDFLSRMSHELRTPMNSILGFSQLLERELVDPQQQESLGYIRKAGRHLLDLINEVLDISRIEADRLTMSIEPVHVTDVVTETAELIMPLAADHNVTLELDQSSDTATYVSADRQRLKQVLLNLLSNGVKYNRSGGRVRVGWTAENDRVQIAVADTGLGIPEDRIDALFEPFNRLGAESSEIEGTGLGLALSKRLVEMMDGAIDVTSSSEGSTFVVSVHQETAPDLHDEHITLPALSIETEPQGEAVVLYVEDNLANVRLMEQILRRRPGVKLLTAMQGGLGLQLAQDHRPDLILLDLHLPDMDGDRVLRQLRADDLTQGTPVVMVTADATAGQRRRLLDAGADEYLTKPLDVDRFLSVVDRYTRESSPALT